MQYTDDHIQQQIEAYLNQEMSDLERSRFEKLIHDDEALHEEVELQEATVDAIRKERILAMKAGLGQVNISLWSAGLIETAKFAAITASIGIVSVGGYFYYQDHEKDSFDDSAKTERFYDSKIKTERKQEVSLNVKSIHDLNENSKVISKGSRVSENFNQTTTTVFPSSDQKAGNSEKGTSVGNARPEQKSATLVDRKEVYEPNARSVQPLTGKDVPLPEDGISNKTSLESIHPEVIIKKDNKNIFHYQFLENKLVLYADFSNKLYEVLELNQDNEKRIFFSYENHFYQLDPSQNEIAPLNEVQDRSMIQILTAYQKRRN